MNIRAPVAEVSVGLCSILYSSILMLLVSGFFCEDLLSVMHIISSLFQSGLSSFICENNDDIFRRNNEKSCCFIWIFLNCSISRCHGLWYFVFCLRVDLVLWISLDKFLFFDQLFKKVIFWKEFLIGGFQDLYLLRQRRVFLRHTAKAGVGVYLELFIVGITHINTDSIVSIIR